MNEKLLKKYAKLIVKVGANVQLGQLVVLNVSTENKEFARLIVEEAYEAGAGEVMVQWSDSFVSRQHYFKQTVEKLEEVPEWTISKAHYIVDNQACFIHIDSTIPEIFKDVDGTKIHRSTVARQLKMEFYQEYTMANRGQWTIASAPNKYWAKKLFPNLNEEEAIEKLWQKILEACRVTKDNDPVLEWEIHNQNLLKHNQVLNDYNFDRLIFKNKLGTNLSVKLVDNHIWCGGGEYTDKGVYFNPNIPTEENFTMPDNKGTEGIVYATKPLNFRGKIIEDFWLKFEKGQVVDFGAKKEQTTLSDLLNTDEGSRRIGEIALISHNSPISNTNLLFLTTLFDENASCHMALGRAYPMNIKGGLKMTKDELKAQNSNHSLVHVDFMFGSADMEIIGVQKDGKKIPVFKEGNFVI